jgi:hypothetical protein
MAGSCINVHALVSGLASRVAREGYRPTQADLSALLRAGASPDSIARAFSAVDRDEAREALTLLAKLTAGVGSSPA